MNDVMKVEANALRAQTEAEIDVVVSTANKYKRDMNTFYNRCLDMAKSDQEIAESCYYKLQRKGKDGAVVIEGPSIRLAEIMAYNFKNIRVISRITEITDAYVVAQAIAMDCENNHTEGGECRRRIVTRDGNRYSEDMIITTSMAAMEIARRNAIFKIIPKSYAKILLDSIKRHVAGDNSQVIDRFKKAVKKYESINVSEAQLLDKIGKSKVEELVPEDIATLIGIYTAIQDRETTVEDEFRDLKKVEDAPETSKKPVENAKKDKTPKQILSVIGVQFVSAGKNSLYLDLVSSYETKFGKKYAAWDDVQIKEVIADASKILEEVKGK